MKELGFTLVELAIVLVIIGLLVGGVLVGRDLIKAAEIRGTISDIEKMSAAYNTFRLKYHCLPGDCRITTRFFSDLENGDGNRIIDCWSNGGANPDCYAPTDEHTMAMRSLNRAGLFASGLTADSGITTPTRLNECKLNLYKGGEYFYGNQSKKNFLRIFNALDAAPWNDDCMTPQEAYDIDRKIDDGMASTGRVLGFRFNGTLPKTDCTSVDYYTPLRVPPTPYNFDFTGFACSLYVRM